MPQILKINGVSIKSPSSLKFNSYNLTKSGRVASGKMVMDLVAKKRKFEFTYDVINSTDKKTILDLIDSDEMFFTLEYTEDNIVKTAKVYVGEINRDRFRTSDPTSRMWYWKDLGFNLIEQ